MKIKSNSFWSLLLALPITSLASIPASAATLTWLGGTCSLDISQAIPPTSLTIGGCVKSQAIKDLDISNKINDLHITLSVLNKNTGKNEELKTDFFFNAGTEPTEYKPIWSFQDLMGFGYNAQDQRTQAISIVDAKSYWTIDGKKVCLTSPDKKVELHSNKTSGSKFAWGLLDSVLGLLITPAYATGACPVPEPDSSAGMVLMGTTLLLLGMKIKLKAKNPSHT
ncbi:hypothetical protein B6N60_01145 [Richelia sinica FACHB-800]|uniref:Uncharacterized protein n=1 Tax=Richelia sinica FACHB-800 TaxID=1357546 RepID=A0A975T5D6_9NOST|nr:hypothetical protein [Richelia sinica]MBD2664306.1 hypothetical protein [Richelia sinica FACHB-800]QXE22462.1 hypothetical protein B6N60_01145 [Richelia sinica FACHB-800]